VRDEIRHSDRMWVKAAHPLTDDPLLHMCAVAYVSDFGSGFGQTEVEGLPVGGPSIDHAVWFHEPIRADEWMLLETAPTKALASRGVYRGAITGVDGRVGAVLAQEMLLRELKLDDETRRRVAEYLGVPEAG
jgi:acyl-CoA thioesterase-2